MSWHKCKLGELISIKHGWAFKGEFFSEKGCYLLLSPGNAHESGGLKIREGKEKFYIGDFPKEFLLKKGAVVIIMTDLVQSAPILGASIKIPEDNKFLHNQRLGLVSINDTSVLDQEYAYHIFNLKNYREQVRGSASGATVRHTAPERIYKCEVVIPESLEVQKKVASTLSNYDDLIQTNQQRIALLEEAAQRLYDEWFVKLRFPNHEQVPVVDGVPEGWERVTFADICESVGGGTPSTKVNEYWENGDVSWVTPTDITRLSSLILLDTEKKITQKGLKDSSAKMLPANTILMTSRASIGYFGLIDRPVCTNQGFISIIPNNDIDRMFILFNLKSRLEEIDGLATGSTFKELSRRVFRAMSITLPTIELRQFFSDFVLPLFEQMRTITQQNQKLAQARDALLPRLMSGKMDVSCLSLKEIA